MAAATDLPVRIARAIFSVDDKSGLAALARGLADLQVELWATGGTRAALASAGIVARESGELTGVGSWFGGRVKTLHPAILGGILAPRTAEGLAELRERGLLPFDLVVVNLYPFERHLTEHPGAGDREEYIDIGGVTLARAAAKNHAYVTAIVDPGEYGPVLEELRAHQGAISGQTRRRLAVRAFERCTAYDQAISDGLRATDTTTSDPFPETILFHREPLRLRYGENPHQRAATYVAASSGLPGEEFTALKGEAPSFTNLLDASTALSIVAEFPGPTVAVVKHATPCGVASGVTVREAIERAVATDPVARYGCAIAVNRPVAAEDVPAFHGIFVDLLAAPAFDAGARQALERRTRLKLLQTDPSTAYPTRWEAHSALGRLLLQEADRRQLVPSEYRLVSGTKVTPEEACSLDFAWRVARHAKSNAIVLSQGSATVGIGSGQPTRSKSVELACEVAGPRAKGAVLASDAFFPFADGIEIAGRAGVRAILQPGGSLRDPEVLAMAERYGISMYFTGWRIFRH